MTVSPPGPLARLAASREHLFASPSETCPYPLVIQRAQGSVVEDVDGNRYLDFTAGLTIGPTGHAHPQVVQAIEQAARRLMAQSGRGQYEPATQLSRRLAELAPGDERKRVRLTSHGEDALRAAIELACRHTGRDTVVVFDDAHDALVGGRGIAKSGSHHHRRRHTMLRAKALRYGDVDAVAGTLAPGGASRDGAAAVLVEPTPWHGSDPWASPTFLPVLRTLCDRYGAVLIMDERRTGLGRTGRMFCCEHSGVVPDILVTSGAQAAGAPLGAAIVRESLVTGQTASSFTAGGDPIGCAATLAAIDVIERQFARNAARLFPFAIGKLREMTQRHNCLARPAGRGLLLLVEVVRPRRATASATELRDRIILEAFRRGVLLSPAGDRTILLTPSLCINRVQTEVGLDVFEEAVATVSV
jgi:4-aminobutyrate aminotransferase